MPKRKAHSIQVDDSLHARLEWLHESEGGGDGRSKVGPPCLYIDDQTVLEEVRDITALRKGDHCIVGLNAMRKLHWTFDWFTWWCSKWGVLRVYHHFIMMDDVATVEYSCTCAQCTREHSQTEKKESPEEVTFARCGRAKFKSGPVPLTTEGKLSMICEYSGTPARAARALFQGGPTKSSWLKMAPFQKLPLADYVHNTGTGGIFRVVRDEPLTTEEVERIMKSADKLLNSYQPYDFLFTNCESVAFALNPGTKRWRTPEVPHLLWVMFRCCLALVGVICLTYIREHGTHFPSDVCQTASRQFATVLRKVYASSDEGFDNLEVTTAGCSFRVPLAPLFHFFVTTPIGLQLLIHLVRSTVHLTSKRESLGERSFHHLLAKEVGRSVVVGGFCVFVLSQVPRVVHESGNLWIAAFVSLCGFTVANSAYGALARGTIEAFKHTVGGVPVVTFFDHTKESQEQGVLRHKVQVTRRRSVRVSARKSRDNRSQ